MIKDREECGAYGVDPKSNSKGYDDPWSCIKDPVCGCVCDHRFQAKPEGYEKPSCGLVRALGEGPWMDDEANAYCDCSNCEEEEIHHEDGDTDGCKAGKSVGSGNDRE